VKDDIVLRQQYLDFVRCRRFRQTLLCHADVPIAHAIKPESLRSLYFASPACQVKVEEGSVEGLEEFHGPKDSRIRTSHPPILRVLHRLVEEWPKAISFTALNVEDIDFDEVFEILHVLFQSGLIEIRSAPPAIAVVPGERPTASALARLQASQGAPIFSLRHTTILSTGAIEKRLISLLDGTRTREQIFAELKPMLDSSKPDSQLKDEFEISLNSLGRLSILTA
jgi:methyltransferase-like protein